MRVGTKPVDGGHYIFDEAEKNEFLRSEPRAKSIMRPFIGGFELINGVRRWILNPLGCSPQELRSMPLVMDRISKVSNFRKNEGGNLSKELASKPTEFHVTVLPDRPFLALPEVSSELRDYIPIAYLDAPVIPSNQVLVAMDASYWLFGIITSSAHMSWVKYISGRLKSDYRYSPGLVYNPFPWPDLDDAKKEKLDKLGQAILDARLQHPQSTLADLYDPLTMPADLRKAHEANDKAVDQLYRKEAFASDRARVEFLLARYEQITAPALALAAQKPKKARKAK
jgi:hypothetical protein